MGRVEVAKAFQEGLGGENSTVFVPIGRGTARMAADIRSGYNLTRTGAFQIAVAIHNNCGALVTNDKGLSEVTDLKIILVEEPAGP
jgi:predicted nucleic acid-binding protein